MPIEPSPLTGRPTTILSIKNKGGVSGSHNVMATATALRLSGAEQFVTTLVDLDGSTGTSISKMGERDEHGQLKTEQSFAHGVPAFSLFDPDERSALFDIVEQKVEFLLLDGPAASLNTFGALTENLGPRDWVQHNDACGRDLIIMIPVTPHFAALTTVAEAIQAFGVGPYYVVVRSMRGCSARDYVLWDELEFRNRFGNVVSGRSKEMLEAVGGSVLDMPALNAAVLARAEAMQIPFAEAINSDHLRAHERLSIARWLEAWTKELDKIRRPLGLPDNFGWVIR